MIQEATEHTTLQPDHTTLRCGHTTLERKHTTLQDELPADLKDAVAGFQRKKNKKEEETQRDSL